MKEKMNHRFICFAIATVALLTTLFFTSCSSTAAKVESSKNSSKPCYHVTVYSPAIGDFYSNTRRAPKYTITVDSFSELMPDPESAEMEYHFLRIPLGGGRFELVLTSLVEIEYY